MMLVSGLVVIININDSTVLTIIMHHGIFSVYVRAQFYLNVSALSSKCASELNINPMRYARSRILSICLEVGEFVTVSLVCDHKKSKETQSVKTNTHCIGRM